MPDTASAPPFARLSRPRELLWAVGIPRIQKVYSTDVEMIWPTATRGRPRQTAIPSTEAISAETMLASAPWRAITWRRDTKGPLRADFAAVRVRVADGPEVRIGRRAGQHLPGEEVWLVGERRSSGEQKYYLSNLPAGTRLKRLAAIIKARWVCEQAHQQLKEELGLDHFEGRSWRGLHRHALMTLIAFAFLQHHRLAAAERGKKAHRTPAAAEPAGGAASHHRSSRTSAPTSGTMSSLVSVGPVPRGRRGPLRDFFNTIGRKRS